MVKTREDRAVLQCRSLAEEIRLFEIKQTPSLLHLELEEISSENFKGTYRRVPENFTQQVNEVNKVNIVTTGSIYLVGDCFSNQRVLLPVGSYIPRPVVKILH